MKRRVILILLIPLAFTAGIVHWFVRGFFCQPRKQVSTLPSDGYILFQRDGFTEPATDATGLQINTPDAFVPRSGSVVKLRPDCNICTNGPWRDTGTLRLPWFTKGRRIYFRKARSHEKSFVGFGVFPTLAKDGRLAFLRWNAYGSIAIVEPDGSKRRTLKPPGSPVENLTWSPDGDWLLFSYPTDPLWSSKAETYGLGVIRTRDGMCFRLIPGEIDHVKFHGIGPGDCIKWVSDLTFPCIPLGRTGSQP